MAEGMSELSHLSSRKRAGLGAVLAGLPLRGWVGSYISDGFCEPNTGLSLYSPLIQEADTLVNLILWMRKLRLSEINLRKLTKAAQLTRGGPRTQDDCGWSFLLCPQWVSGNVCSM